MKSADEIIRRARYRTKNSNYGYTPATGVYTSGISTELFLDAINDAQDHLQAALINAGTNLFIANSEISCVGSQQDYTIPDRVFGGTNILAVQYNSNNNSTDYGGPLRKFEPRDRVSLLGAVGGYIPYSGKISLLAIPDSSGGRIRPEYYRELDDLDIRRGQVTAAPVGAVIQLNAAPVPDQYQIENAEYICICDRWGTVKMRNGLFSSYNAGLRQITLAANVNTYLVTGYVLADLASCYVTVGKYTSTHSGLPDHCERYLRVYTQKRVMTSADDATSIEEDAELVKIEMSILDTYADEDRDVEEMTIIDDEIME